MHRAVGAIYFPRTMNRISRHLTALASLALASCARVQSIPSPASAVNTAESAIAPDAVADAYLVEVVTMEPSIRVEMRYATAENFTGAPLPGYLANRAFLRREATVALVAVQRKLRAHGVGLLVYDAYRPARATDAMVEWTRRAGRNDLLRDGYIAGRSRHNLGLAIDLTLYDLVTGVPLDMGTPFDTFSAAAHTANATGLPAVNRARLKSAMESAGFRNYAREWWHYSFAATPGIRFDRVIR